MMTLEREMTLTMRIGTALLGLVLTACAVLSVAGCSVAAGDRATVYTEEGLRAASQMWDAHYDSKLAECSGKFEAETREAEVCFGATYDADAVVASIVYAAVMALRVYWTARAAGKPADWTATVAQVQQILSGLPPEVRQYFDRVKGIPK